MDDFSVGHPRSKQTRVMIAKANGNCSKYFKHCGDSWYYSITLCQPSCPELQMANKFSRIWISWTNVVQQLQYLSSYIPAKTFIIHIRILSITDLREKEQEMSTSSSMLHYIYRFIFAYILSLFILCIRLILTACYIFYWKVALNLNKLL